MDDLIRLFGGWRWRGKSDVMVISGLTLATWVQTIWAWRPRIDILGGSNTGKSMLCSALFSDCCILTSDTTAAGLRQEIKNSAVAVIVDEVDGKNKAKLASTWYMHRPMGVVVSICSVKSINSTFFDRKCSSIRLASPT